ncbi:MAG: alpha/beta fold hydrolase [Acetobacterium woodii]|nr:alpha/beta fold hydrolase [Acetobacterium woodii]
MLAFLVVLLILIVAITAVLLVFNTGKMIPYRDAAGNVLRGSLSEKSWVNINGVDMGMIIKAKDVTKPILLFVHGGPGMPEYWLNHSYPSHLDELFMVVWWDQRGAGLSYRSDISPETMTTAQIVDDTIAVSNYLRQRFRQDKIYLMAHSYGTYIGIQAAAKAPQLYHAYIGVAQVANLDHSEELAHDFMLDYYKNADDQKIVKQLEEAPYDSEAYQKIRDRLMHQAGIGTIHNMYSVISGIFLGVMKNREYMLLEKINIWRGKAFSKNTTLNEEFRRCDLGETLIRVDVPLYFFSGTYDYTVNHYLSEVYLDEIQAPKKHFYLFEDSAHSPIFEEPDAVTAILKCLIR